MNPILNLNSTFTGAVVQTFSSTAPTGWLLLNGTTIGSATSGANYANADAKNLFVFLWTHVSNAVASVSGGRGASAAADWAANKTLTLPDARGRAIICAGTGNVSEVITNVTASSNTVGVGTNDRRWVTGMPVTLSSVSGFTGLTNGNYWIIRTGSGSVSFASSLANAQAGTAVVISGTGSATITHNYTARTLGENGGVESHAMSNTELPAHTHTTDSAGAHTHAPASGVAFTTKSSSGGSTYYGAGAMAGTPGTDTATSSAGAHTHTALSTGGNNAMNNMQPFLAMNFVIKL